MQQQYDYSKFKEYLQLKGYSSATINTIINVMKDFIKWMNTENITEPEEVSYTDILAYIKCCSGRGVSQKTISHYLIQVQKYYSFLMKEGNIKENPVSPVKIQGIKRKIYYDILTPDELHELWQQYPLATEQEENKSSSQQHKNILSKRRNKVIISLVIHQGLRVEELAALTLQDLALREGKITIHSQRRIAARTMKLESHQVYELMDYIHETRKHFLQTNQITGKLFLHWRSTENFRNITQYILQHLRKINSRIKNFDQLRASVITQWLKQYDLRKAQYLSGHKYVSSTEQYKANVIDELQDDITKYHPL